MLFSLLRTCDSSIEWWPLAASHPNDIHDVDSPLPGQVWKQLEECWRSHHVAMNEHEGRFVLMLLTHDDRSHSILSLGRIPETSPPSVQRHLHVLGLVGRVRHPAQDPPLSLVNESE